MNLVYICSPLRGDIAGNIRKATDYCRYATEKGVVPFAPHVSFTSFLDDLIPEERILGMKLGLEVLKRCDELWAFFENRPSEGMLGEIQVAESLGIPVKYFNHNCERKYYAN